MRKVTLIALTILFLGIGAKSASASPTSTENSDSFQSKRLWHFASLPVWFVAWANVHEGSHALTAMAHGYDIIAYKPWPGLDSYGNFHLAHFEATRSCKTNENGECIDRTAPIHTFMAPYLTDVIIFTTFDTFLSTGIINPDSLSGGVAYVGGMVIPLLDIAFNLGNPIGNLDRSEISKYSRVNETYITLSTDAVIAVGLWRLYKNGKRVFFDKDHKVPKEKLKILPSVSTGYTGVTISLDW